MWTIRNRSARCVRSGENLTVQKWAKVILEPRPLK
jgi:hypothetical protein